MHLLNSKALCSRGRRPRSTTSGAASLGWEVMGSYGDRLSVIQNCLFYERIVLKGFTIHGIRIKFMAHYV